MTVAVLERTTRQRLASLVLANEARVYRAQLKRRMTRDLAAELLLTPAPLVAKMAVSDLLTAIPKYGPTKVRNLMRVCRVSDAKTVGGMSQRQREELARELTA